MKHKQKHNFIEVENKITYADSIVNKSREEKIIPFCHFTINVAYLVFVIMSPAKLNFFYVYEIFKIIKKSCNTLTFQ